MTFMSLNWVMIILVDMMYILILVQNQSAYAKIKDRKQSYLQSNANSDDFTVLVLFYFGDYLAFLGAGEKEWTLLEDLHGIRDIISCNAKFYAIERGGRTIVIDQSLNVSFLNLERVGSPTSRKFLVKSTDNLLAVEMLLRISYHDAEMSRYSLSRGDNSSKIYRMNEEGQKWDEKYSLGDQILFLGLHQSISASASEFYWGEGNRMFYSSKLSMPLGYNNSEHRLMFVFNLKTGTASPLEDCPPYCNLFWPPTEWVTYPESVISSRLGISKSTHSVTSATPEIEYKYPESNLAISTRVNLLKGVTSAGKEVGASVPFHVQSAASSFVGSKLPSPSSKCSFKFCCF